MNNNITPPFPIINLGQPDNVDGVTWSTEMDDRLRKLLHRRRDLISEGQEIERQLRIMDRRWAAAEAAAENLLSA